LWSPFKEQFSTDEGQRHKWSPRRIEDLRREDIIQGVRENRVLKNPKGGLIAGFREKMNGRIFQAAEQVTPFHVGHARMEKSDSNISVELAIQKPSALPLAGWLVGDNGVPRFNLVEGTNKKGCPQRSPHPHRGVRRWKKITSYHGIAMTVKNGEGGASLLGLAFDLERPAEGFEGRDGQSLAGEKFRAR